jgi:hypothetical protein
MIWSKRASVVAPMKACHASLRALAYLYVPVNSAAPMVAVGMRNLRDGDL